MDHSHDHARYDADQDERDHDFDERQAAPTRVSIGALDHRQVVDRLGTALRLVLHLFGHPFRADAIGDRPRDGDTALRL